MKAPQLGWGGTGILLSGATWQLVISSSSRQEQQQAGEWPWRRDDPHRAVQDG